MTVPELARPRQPTQPDLGEQSAPFGPRGQASHLIAVNCHPFHDLEDLLSTLDSLAPARAALAEHSDGVVAVRLFWHSPVPVPPNLTSSLSKYGFKLTTAPHVSNGDNLNSQIEHALRKNTTFFYRVDADDAVMPQRFVLQARLLMQGHCDLCGGGLLYKPATGAPFKVLPNPIPRARDFIENKYVLHPTMAFRVAAFDTDQLRYWSNRLEDKHLLLQVCRIGLRVRNLPVVLGSYKLTPQARRSFAFKWLGLRLNLRFVTLCGAWWLGGYAVFLFAAQAILGSAVMRRARAYRDNALQFVWQNLNAGKALATARSKLRQRQEQNETS